MTKNKNKTLVLGIGNDILTDDGIGPKLCDFLKEVFHDKPIEFEKLNVGGLEVLEFIQGYETVIFIDAIKTVNGQIGEVYLYTPDDFKETLHLSNLHDTNFITALGLGKSLDFNIPKNMHIIAIEIKEDMIFSEYFTEELAVKFDEVKQKVVKHINELCFV
ncbi:hydrogenase maturation protease [Draconibacterium sp.]|nr:hydrogenase maturation protease [Draconibacterium sp.]